MKYCVIILDGAAGWPLPELGGRTTLQAASTPNLDAMARAGMVGLAQTVPESSEPSSSAACMSILGYDPIKNYVGRAAIEAASMGISLASDEIALRLNLVTIVDGAMRSYAGGHISTAEAHAVVADLGAALDDKEFRVYPGVGYRHILVVKGHPEILDLRYTPPHDIPGRLVGEYLPTGSGALVLLRYMERARRVLERSLINRERAAQGVLPVTDVWPFWPGVTPSGIRAFESCRAVRAAMTSGVDLLNGLAALTGIARLDIPGVTDGHDNDYVAQATGACAALNAHDLVVVHVESPDEAGHGGDTATKIAAIEAIDREVVSRVLDFPEDVRVLAMPDHPTPVALKTHVGEAVPFVVYGRDVSPNGADTFDEAAAGGTGLFVDPGHGVMDLLLER